MPNPRDPEKRRRKGAAPSAQAELSADFLSFQEVVDRVGDSWFAGTLDDPMYYELVSRLGNKANEPGWSEDSLLGTFLSPLTVCTEYSTVHLHDKDVREYFRMLPRGYVSMDRRIEYLELDVIPDLFFSQFCTSDLVAKRLVTSSGHEFVMVLEMKGHPQFPERTRFWGPIATVAEALDAFADAGYIASLFDWEQLSPSTKRRIVRGWMPEVALRGC